MAMMKATLNKQAHPGIATLAVQAVQTATPLVPENIQQQLCDMQSQVLHFTMRSPAGPAL